MPNYDKVTELEVRQALAYAYDVRGRLVGGRRDRRRHPGQRRHRPRPGLRSAASGHGRPPARGTARTRRADQYDPEKSKELLKAAGFEPGEYEVSFVYDASTPEGEAGAEQRKLGYEEAGFKVKKYPYTAGTLYDVWTDPDSALYKKINLLGTAWCQDWPSAATFLPVIVGGENPRRLQHR